MVRNITRLAAFSALALLIAGCGTHPTTKQEPAAKTVDVSGLVRQKLAGKTTNKDGWAKAVATAFDGQKIPPTRANVCAVLAVAEQESNYQSDPKVPGLGKIAWGEIERRAGKMYVPAFVVHTALKVPSSNGKSYAERLDAVTSERQLSDIYDDLIDRVPLGQKLFGSYNPVHTGGPMQVSIAFAEEHSRGYPYSSDNTVRQEVFTLRGGVWYGTWHLLNYPVNYSRMLYRFADFNAGWYASRNAAFQRAVSIASGTKLALDGDLVRYDSDEAGKTELAVRKLGGKLGLSDAQIHRQLKKGDSIDFEQTELYSAVYRLAESKSGKKLDRAVLPGITLESPKITRNLTTAWFAQRVESRWTRCMNN
ncbi:hypothetical protein TUM12370_29170 [Salmonella enterica subsp. enterica serovar Choleraesuis]|nr:hypothetical protein TUM12370_29170 [Salmonella enterica subsp. enterica serovar Choleraesuis]